MRTVVSLPGELFEAVERVVRRSGRRRSDVYAEALREYVTRHAREEGTEALNAVVARLDESLEQNRFVGAAGRRVLSKTEW